MKAILKSIVVFIVTLEAQLVLKRYKPKVIVVTGSVGKTGTKDALYEVLRSHVRVRKSEKSFNSEVGVPLTILGLPNAWSNMRGWLANIVEGFFLCIKKQTYPAWLVLEVGVDHVGDMRRLRWLCPHIIVFTHFPEVPVHVENFGSREAIIAEKREIKHALRDGGTLFVNADDPEMADEKVREGQAVVRFGFAEHADVRGRAFETVYEEGAPVGVACDVLRSETVQHITVRGVLGKHNLYAYLVALGVLARVVPEKEVGANTSLVFQGVSASGRMHFLRGVHGSGIVDDTYNASPVAVEAGIQTLAELPVSGRRIVVLGDMMELGNFSIEAHARVGRLVAQTAHMFIGVGVRMQQALEVARKENSNIQTEYYKSAKEAGEHLRDILAEGDMVFVKGSQSMRMERAVEQILEDPSTTGEVLVRQSKEWKKR